MVGKSTSSCTPSLSATVQDVLLYNGATVYGTGGTPALVSRSPRNSFNPEASNFMHERGSYQAPLAAPWPEKQQPEDWYM